MALFGVQVVLTMIIASFLHKISPFYSFGRWFITFRLKRIITPSDDTLRPHVSVSNSNQKNKKKGTNGAKGGQTTASGEAVPGFANRLDQNLVLPKSSKIKLFEVAVNSFDVAVVHYWSELEWMFNLLLATLSVVGITQLYYYLQPDALSTEYNLSTVWLMLTGIYVLYVLGSLTLVYMSEELSHQRSVCIVFTMLFFVLALIILLLDETTIDFGLRKTYSNLVKCISRLFDMYSEGPSSNPEVPSWAFRISLAIAASLLSSLLVFPGLRFADLHFNALRYTKSKLMKALLHVAYISPFLCLSLWIRPLSLDMFAEKDDTVNMFGAYEVSYNHFRVCTVLTVVLYRFLMYWYYMQTYLNTAKWRIEEMKFEYGRISVRDYRSRITNIFLFYCAMGVQYIAPYVLLLCTMLLVFDSSRIDYSSLDLEDNDNLKLAGFGVSVFFGCFQFFSWWICLVQTVTTGIGAVLREYL